MRHAARPTTGPALRASRSFVKQHRRTVVRLLIALLLAVFGWEFAQTVGTAWFGQDGQAELTPIRQQDGSRRYSRNVEEWLIRDHFKDRRNGVFVDVGANHYKDESNTYFLETELGWSGIAIDALPRNSGPTTKHTGHARNSSRFLFPTWRTRPL